jgi:protein TonB
MQWRFQPALDANGKAEAGRVLVPITFDVNGEPDVEPAPNPAPMTHAAAKPSAAATADAVPIPEPREVSAAQAPAPMATYDALQPPRYPIAAINERRAGTVMLRVLVGSDGLPEQVELEASSGSPDLDEAAIAAAREWNFDPAHDGYKAIPSWVLVPVNFSLDPPAADRGQRDVAGDA